MAFKSTALTLILILIAAITYNTFLLIQKPSPKPEMDPEAWWGPGKAPASPEDTLIQPFNINVTQKALDDIKLRLSISRPFTPPLENTQHEYGLNTKLLTTILEYLKTKYDFQERQKFLNKYPQFTTRIQGLKIHFLHVKPLTHDGSTTRVLPILLLHGWPSSVREFYEMIPTLTQHQKDIAFNVVIPSIPGFGYSDGSAKTNCQAPHLAVVLKNLMQRLGYEKFYVHGSDWGSFIGANIATLFPNHTLGYHSNFCVSLRYVSFAKTLLGSLWPSTIVPEGYQQKIYPLYQTVYFYLKEGGYFHLQATKPDTVGVALENSLEGLIAYTFEKLSVGTNKNNIFQEDAGLLEKLDLTLLLDTILFYYWFPGTATTSARIYAENFNLATFLPGVNNIPIDQKVPCACAFFEHEFIYQPEAILRDKFTNLVQFNYYKVGGHFIALEENKLLVNDIISFVSKTLQNNFN